MTKQDYIELVEKFKDVYKKNSSTPHDSYHDFIIECAQIAVDYASDIQTVANNLSADQMKLIKQRDELLEAMREFTNAIESEEITIQENCDNDGWENCGGRLYETFKQLINKIDGK